MPYPCDGCGSGRKKTPKSKLCRSCSNKKLWQTGKFKGRGRRGYVTRRGYIWIWRAIDKKYRQEHVLIAEAALGRKLKNGEMVHHINGVKSDNRASNLVVCTQSYHASLHQRMGELWQKENFSAL